jgi:hypothetical protein
MPERYRRDAARGTAGGGWTARRGVSETCSGADLDIDAMPTPSSLPDDHHRRPDGVDGDTVAAVGKLSEAVEWIERARGRLFDFHQLIGHADLLLEEAADMLDEAGHEEMADRLRVEVIGRNVLDGRWTFQVVDEFERSYYDPVCEAEHDVRGKLLDGRRHVFEAELKERRRTPRRRGHESRPPARADD